MRVRSTGDGPGRLCRSGGNQDAEIRRRAFGCRLPDGSRRHGRAPESRGSKFIVISEPPHFRRSRGLRSRPGHRTVRDARRDGGGDEDFDRGPMACAVAQRSRSGWRSRRHGSTGSLAAGSCWPCPTPWLNWFECNERAYGCAPGMRTDARAAAPEQQSVYAEVVKRPSGLFMIQTPA